MLPIMSLDQDDVPLVSEAQDSGRGLGSGWNGEAVQADGTA